MKYVFLFLSVLCNILWSLFTAALLQLFWGLNEGVSIPIVLEGTDEFTDIWVQLIAQDVGILFIAIVFAFLSVYFYSLYHRRNKKKRDTLDKDSIQSPFVLYLRSFIDDKTTKKRVALINDMRTEEEVLVSVMSDIAPVYAIGDPKDKKMPLGASRVYVADEHWKSTVMDLMNRAQVVILRLGKTDSFWWEVEEALKSVPLDKLLFVIPECRTFDNIASLYKILLEHGIDIKNVNISIDQKSQGSISSFVYFDSDGQVHSTQVKTPHLTKLVLSFETILRNALSNFRKRFGFEPVRKLPIRKARILEISFFLFLIFVSGSKLFSHWVDLNVQMPYELVEECIEYPEFVEEYSNEINGFNLHIALENGLIGMFGLDDDKYMLLFLIHAQAFSSMSPREFELIDEKPQNLLLLVKKYVPESYEMYVKLLAQAAYLNIKYPQDIYNLILAYQSDDKDLPQWIADVLGSKDFQNMSDYEGRLRIDSVVLEHADDEDIVQVLKTVSSRSLSM